MIGLAVAMAGCLSEPPPTTESSSQEVRNGSDDPPDPEPDPPVCVHRQGCSLTFLGGYNSTTQSQLGCSQNYRYWNGYPAGFMGGIGAFCPNTSTVRSIFHGYGIQPSGYCDECLTVPTNKVFIFWTYILGPGCPSGCTPGPYPSPL